MKKICIKNVFLGAPYKFIYRERELKKIEQKFNRLSHVENALVD